MKRLVVVAVGAIAGNLLLKALFPDMPYLMRAVGAGVLGAVVYIAWDVIRSWLER